MNIVDRVKNILITPKTEWSVIEGEPENVTDLYKNYIGILAAIPVLAFFVGKAIFGRSPIFSSLVGAVIQYALTLVLVYGIALIIDALAPHFGGQKNLLQSLKIVAYSSTAGWVAGIGWLLPGLGPIIVIIGSLYGIYLLYLGLPQITKCAVDKAPIYVAAIAASTILLTAIVMAIIGKV
jgi:hypothetical protein